MLYNFYCIGMYIVFLFFYLDKMCYFYQLFLGLVKGIKFIFLILIVWVFEIN